MITPQAALVYAMVVAAECDDEIADDEIAMIGDIARQLPVFDEVDREEITDMAMTCSAMLAQTDGQARILYQVRAALSPELRETAYALVCDVISSDRRLHHRELDLLDEIRVHLDLSAEVGAAIRQAAEVRFQAA